MDRDLVLVGIAGGPTPQAWPKTGKRKARSRGPSATLGCVSRKGRAARRPPACVLGCFAFRLRRSGQSNRLRLAHRLVERKARHVCNVLRLAAGKASGVANCLCLLFACRLADNNAFVVVRHDKPDKIDAKREVVRDIRKVRVRQGRDGQARRLRDSGIGISARLLHAKHAGNLPPVAFDLHCRPCKGALAFVEKSADGAGICAFAAETLRSKLLGLRGGDFRRKREHASKPFY
jgi:hypothetical protein